MKKLSLNVGNLNIVALVSEMSEDAVISLRPLVEHLGLKWSGQQKKIVRSPQFSHVHMYTTVSDGKKRKLLCLPAKQLGVWLSTVDANRMKPEVREKFIQFQMHLQVAIQEALVKRASPDLVTKIKEVAELKEAILTLTQQASALREKTELLKNRTGEKLT